MIMRDNWRMLWIKHPQPENAWKSFDPRLHRDIPFPNWTTGLRRNFESGCHSVHNNVCTALSAGNLFAENRVERILGQGGMGIVVAFRHVELGQLSAMKFLLPAVIGREESVERFLRKGEHSLLLDFECGALPTKHHKRGCSRFDLDRPSRRSFKSNIDGIR